MQNGIKYDSNLIFSKLIEAIKSSGLSFGEIARLTGIPKSSIHRYASGQTKKIPIDAVRLIASATGVSTSYIMGWEDESELVISNKKKGTTQNESSLSPEQRALLTAASELSDDDLKKALEYVELLKLKRNS